ncbi:MAG: 5-(carboxyamino)imidazole ribonucleotide synthase [Acidimicrobiia bacterium]
MEIKKVSVVGGGQLAQMMGQAGKKIGVQINCAGDETSCAFSDCIGFIQDLSYEKELKKFLDGVCAFTFESEHEGYEIAKLVEKYNVPVYPNAEFVKTAGDRFFEKSHLFNLKIPTAPFELIDQDISIENLKTYLTDLIANKKLSSNGIVIKTRHGGYDGKGQWVIKTDIDIEEKFNDIHSKLLNPGCIVEGLVDFDFECSIIASRSISGDFKSWPLSHNIHKDSILARSYSPMTIVENVDILENQAYDIAKKICSENNYVGTIAIECFVKNNKLIVNEIAPRVHNSGHWTIEGSTTSQFEQHLRAITDMKLGETTPLGYSALINIVGREVTLEQREKLSNLDNVYLHWYSKEVRPFRKVGHITIVASDVTSRDELENQVLNILGDPRP